MLLVLFIFGVLVLEGNIHSVENQRLDQCVFFFVSPLKTAILSRMSAVSLLIPQIFIEWPTVCQRLMQESQPRSLEKLVIKKVMMVANVY